MYSFTIRDLPPWSRELRRAQRDRMSLLTARSAFFVGRFEVRLGSTRIAETDVSGASASGERRWNEQSASAEDLVGLALTAALVAASMTLRGMRLLQ